MEERGEDGEERVDSTWLMVEIAREERVDSTAELMEERAEESKDSTELMKERGETFISKLENFNRGIINDSMKHFHFIF